MLEGVQSLKTQQGHFQYIMRAESGLWVNQEVLLLAELAQPFSREKCCLAHLLNPQRAGLGVVMRTPAPICAEPAVYMMLWEAHPAAPLFISFIEAVPSCCQVLNKNKLLVWADLWLSFVFLGSAPLTHRWESRLAQNLFIPILFTPSPVTEDACICGFRRLRGAEWFSWCC